MTSDPIKQLNGCTTIDDLKTTWSENVESWKHRRDFQFIADAKNEAKCRLSWPATLSDAMQKYDECVESFDGSKTIDEANMACTVGETLELQMAETIHRLLAEKWPVGADGIGVLKRYGEWLDDPLQLKFNQGE